MKTKEQFQKGDLVRINTPDNFWNGIVGIYEGAYLENESINNNYYNCWNFFKPIRVRFPQIKRLKIRADTLSEPENLIGYFYAHQLEKVE
jgi:hypothetical protein